MQGDYYVRIGLVALIFFLLAYLAYSYSSLISFDGEWPYLIRGGILLLFFVPFILSYKSSSQLLKHISIWFGIGLLLALGYTYQNDLSAIGSRLKSQLMPSSGIENESGTVKFVRSNDGHFYIEALVNNVPIRFMVDTGATKVSLSRNDAQRLGFDVDALPYNLMTHTANGETMVASVTLPEIKVVSIVVRDISASVSKNLLGESLLGMSFLKKLKGFSVEGDTLLLIN